MSIEPITNPEYDVCIWPVDPACFAADWAGLDESIKLRSLALASATLRRLTGYRVGACPITVRPCKRACAEDYGWFSGGVFTPHINSSGNWVNNGCGCQSDCSCGALCEIELPRPVVSLVEVDLGGVDLLSQVKLYGNKVVWIGEGDCPFPNCQDLTKAPGEPDTFTITYMNSYEPDGMGAYAAGVLAMEFARACTGGKCRLPRGTTSVSRQGVNIEIAAGSFPGGVTGIHEVDAYIALWRPEGSPTRPPMIWSPGQRRPRIER